MSRDNQDLMNLLKEQYLFLIHSCLLYDEGYKFESKRIASVIRTLLHDTSKSTSLLKQIGIKDSINFLNSAPEYQQENTLPSSLLVCQTKSGFTPYYDNYPPFHKKTLFKKFISWKMQVVIFDKNRESFTRQELIHYLANQDGGSHIDPDMDIRFEKLSREGSIGWLRVKNGKVIHFENNIELASMRQMGHEIIRTLEKQYPEIKEDKYICPEPKNSIGNVVHTHPQD